MRRLALPVAAAVAVGVAAAVLLATRHTPSAASAVSRAAAHTLDAGTTRIDFTFAHGTAVGHGSGALDFRSRRGWFALGKRPYVVFDGDAAYVTIATLGIPTTKHWLRMTTGAHDSPFSGPGANPAKLFAFVQTGAREIRKVGPDSLGGVATTRYDGVIGPHHQQMSGASFSIWVDGDRLARRLRIAARLDHPVTEVTFDFSDFGAPVNVDVPAADDVLTEAELTKLIASVGPGDCPQKQLCVTEQVEAK
jgi:hypothetical protein